MAPLSSDNKDLVLAVHSILVPDTWHPERDTGRVKVEVDNHGPTLEGSGNVQSMELEEDAGHHHHPDPLDQNRFRRIPQSQTKWSLIAVAMTQVAPWPSARLR